MKTNTSLSIRIRELFLSGLWIANTNYKELLANVSVGQALQKVANLNTIAALTFHINYYMAGVLHALQGGPLDIRDKFSFDMPPINSEKDWRNLVGELLANAEKFASLVENLSDEKLNEAFVNEKYGSNQRNIEAIIEHSYYHLGQISLIRKMILGH